MLYLALLATTARQPVYKISLHALPGLTVLLGPLITSLVQVAHIAKLRHRKLLALPVPTVLLARPLTHHVLQAITVRVVRKVQ